jgi:sigma-B regulation protein RsbU (phosphoserine phosphatase)
MNFNNQTQTVDYKELESLRCEVAKLRNEKAVFKAQSHLLEKLVSMARSSTEGEVLKAALHWMWLRIKPTLKKVVCSYLNLLEK